VQSERRSWLWDSLFATGALLSIETQLRFGTSSIGPGELCLVLWASPLALKLVGRTDAIVSRACWETLRFWIVFALSLCIGTINAIFIADIHDSALAAHDVLAYLLLAFVTFVMTSGTAPGARLRRIEWLFVVLGAASVLLQAANTWELFALPSIDPWYWDRARGWCDNPDQLALLCLVLAMLALHLAETGENGPARALAVACLIIIAPYGWMAKSNSYSIVMLSGSALFLTLKLLRGILRTRSAVPSIAFATCLLVIWPLGFATTIFDASIKDQIKADLSGVVRREVNSDFALRMRLWSDAVSRGVDARMLGLGPGPHLSIPGVILDGRRNSNEPTNLQHPELGIAPNFESHNSILELFLQGGFLALANLVWLGALAVSRTLRARQDGLTTLLFGLLVYGSFGVILRHPTVWLVICLALLSEQTCSRRLSPSARIVPETGIRAITARWRAWAPA
jgi:hypothetical protein